MATNGFHCKFIQYKGAPAGLPGLRAQVCTSADLSGFFLDQSRYLPSAAGLRAAVANSITFPGVPFCHNLSIISTLFHEGPRGMGIPA